MLLVALTGGIGSGKSTVAEMLERLGAVVVDADELARRAVEPGSPGLVKVVDRFGAGVLRPDGSLDREAMAAIAFGDDEARRALESIVHPEVARLFAEVVDHHRATDDVVVYAVPLLVEAGLAPAFEVIMTVSASEHTRIDRLVRDRGMTSEAVRDRMAAQATDAEREAVAQVVLRNEGSIEELRDEVEALWDRLRRTAG